MALAVAIAAGMTVDMNVGRGAFTGGQKMPVDSYGTGKGESMQHEYLRNFARRMKHIGRYALLIGNSGQKAIWKNYGFTEEAQQLTMVIAAMLFVMEKSLRYENCTLDDITVYLDDLNTQYFHKPMSYEDCRQLGDFIINTVLCNDGIPMYYQAYDFETMAEQKLHISYISNKVVYLENEVRRTSYELTDEGYDFLLGTLEIEDNMKLTIQEMVFQLHMEKQSYDKALDDIRQMFARMRGQVQKIQDAMRRIRRNALSYNVEDYETIMQGDLDTIAEIRQKLQGYRQTVRKRIAEIDQLRETGQEIENVAKLDDLQEIDRYLKLALEEYQKIMHNHYDLKFLYREELENMAAMSLVQRYSLRTEIFDKVMQNPQALEKLDYLLRPLFNQPPGKQFDLWLALVPQRRRVANEEEASTETLDFDEEAWLREQEAKRQAKNQRYEASLRCILQAANPTGHITLREIQQLIEKGDLPLHELIPNISVFKEIMIELIRQNILEIAKLRQEQASFLQDENDSFSLSRCILKLLYENEQWKHIGRIVVARIPAAPPVVFTGILTEQGEKRKIVCSDVDIYLEAGDEA